MRHIILFRHANALSSSLSGADFDRALSPLGEQQAKAASEWIASHLSEPVTIVVSTALRTQQTAQALQAALPLAKLISEARIYEASTSTLIDVLDQHGESPVILIGHNPSLESTLALLTTGQSSAVRGMGTASVAWLTCEPGPLSPSCAEIKLFYSP